jgi:hypothetical protein
LIPLVLDRFAVPPAASLDTPEKVRWFRNPAEEREKSAGNMQEIHKKIVDKPP